jgi:tetratricopeptide (TPR) repeat protein
MAAFFGLVFNGCTMVSEIALHSKLSDANKAFESMDYTMAATRYKSIRDRYPDSPRLEDLMMRQAISHYSIADYHQARDVLLACQKEYPNGRHSADAGEYLKKIDVFMLRETKADLAVLEKATEDLDQLVRLTVKHPGDHRILTAIGNLHWELGNYDDAIRHYHDAQMIAATYEERDLKNDRLVLDNQGKPVPLTPRNMKELEIERHPVMVYDLHEYHSRRADGVLGGDLQFFNLSGRIMNRSLRYIQNITIEVRFLNAQLNILDVQNVYIGTLGPGHIRSFLVKADSYDNLYNIVDYEYTIWMD